MERRRSTFPLSPLPFILPSLSPAHLSCINQIRGCISPSLSHSLSETRLPLLPVTPVSRIFSPFLLSRKNSLNPSQCCITIRSLSPDSHKKTPSDGLPFRPPTPSVPLQHPGERGSGAVTGSRRTPEDADRWTEGVDRSQVVRRVSVSHTLASHRQSHPPHHFPDLSHAFASPFH